MQTQITRRLFVKGMGLLSTSAALAACSNGTYEGSATGTEPEAAVKTNDDGTTPLLAIIHTNDTHGHDYEVGATEKNTGNFSMAAVPALKKEWEDKGYDVLVLDAGDATQGTPMVDVTEGDTAISFMNSCGYDLMCVGNHEFDHGDRKILTFEVFATFPIMSANIVRKDSGETRFTPNKVFELTDDTKVGVFGLTTPATLTTARPDYTEAYTFFAGEDLFKCAQEQVEELRSQGADLVVCVGHLGNQESCVPNTSKQVISNVDGIDIFIDGHDHKLVEEEVEGTLLVETGCYMQNIGLVVIDAGVPINQSLAYGEFDGIDAATQAVIDETRGLVDEELNVVFASTPFTLDGRGKLLRTQETNLGDFYADAVVYDAEESMGGPVDGAIINGGCLRFSIEEGDITLADVKTVVPFADQICVLRITGTQMLEALEAACQNVGSEGAIGAFPQVSRIEYTINATVPYEKGEAYPNSTFFAPAAPGARVTIHSVGGKDFDENATYTIATTAFLASGGDTYYQFKLANDKEKAVMCDFDYEVFVGYLIGPLDHEVPETYREPQGRITIITE